MHTTPEDDLIARLAGQPGRGTFEAHVTIDAADLAARDRFRAACRELGARCVIIELPHGQTRSQPMTATYHTGELAEVVGEVAALAAALRGRGFAVTRVKLEAVASNAGVPVSDEEARRFPPGNYFEFHVKAALPPGGDVAALRAVCREHGAHLSKNALKGDEARRFVTQRAYGVGRARAEARFEALCAALQQAGYALSNRLREYSIFDSNAAVDAGWIDAPAGGP